MNMEREEEIQDKSLFIPPTSVSEAVRMIEEARKRDILPEKFEEDLCNT